MTAYTITIGILFTLWLLPALAIIGLYLGELLRERFGRSSPRTTDGPLAAASGKALRTATRTYSTREHVPAAVFARGPVRGTRQFSLGSVRRVQSDDASQPAGILHWQVHMN